MYKISDWSIAQFPPVVIGRSDYSGTGFSTVIWKPLLKTKHLFHKENIGEQRSSWLMQWDVGKRGIRSFRSRVISFQV